MSPSFPTYDFVNVADVKSERVSNFDAGFPARVTSANGPDKFNSYRSSRLSNAASFGVAVNYHRILVVLGISRPFEIIRRVVQSVVVFVGHLRETVRIWDEGEGYGLMPKHPSDGTVSVGKPVSRVPVFINVGSENLSALSNRLRFTHPNESADTIKATNRALVAHFVKTLKSRYWTPFLSHLARLSLVEKCSAFVNQIGPNINPYFPGLRALEA